MYIEFFKTLFGYYSIRSESRLKKAAAEGGYKWELTKDVTVHTDVVVTADRALIINGKGHCISRTNGADRSQIIRVGRHADLYLKNVRMVNTVGRCIRVDADAKLCADACVLRSAGDGIVNCAKVWACGGTSVQSARIGAAGIRNLRKNETQIGEVTLYKCAVGVLYNEGVLTVMQYDSFVREVIAKDGSEVCILK